MSYLEYSTETIENIKRKINEAQSLLQKNNLKQKPIAAFDADGTLWDTDIGEYFFKYQIKNQLLSRLPNNPLLIYKKKKENHPPDGLSWLAQINAGHSIQQVRKWAQKAKDALHDVPIFPAQKKLIHWLHEQGLEVYIVTASCKWAVEPFAQLMGVSPKNVLGIETHIENNIVTDRVISPITWKQGKAEKIQQVTGQKPLLASGNTMGDFSLLESSQVAIAVRANEPGETLFQTEEALYQEAQKRNWFTHQFSQSLYKE